MERSSDRYKIIEKHIFRFLSFTHFLARLFGAPSYIYVTPSFENGCSAAA